MTDRAGSANLEFCLEELRLVDLESFPWPESLIAALLCVKVIITVKKFLTGKDPGNYDGF